MTQDKLRRIIVAATVAGTLLFVSLFAFILYQVIHMAVLDKRIEKREKEIAELEQIIERKENDLEFFQSELGLETVVRGEYGGYKPEEKNNNE